MVWERLLDCSTSRNSYGPERSSKSLIIHQSSEQNPPLARCSRKIKARGALAVISWFPALIPDWTGSKRGIWCADPTEIERKCRRTSYAILSTIVRYIAVCTERTKGCRWTERSSSILLLDRAKLFILTVDRVKGCDWSERTIQASVGAEQISRSAESMLFNIWQSFKQITTCYLAFTFSLSLISVEL
jgi:hypothetical protein